MNLNLGILHGDTFLPSSSDYYQLIYEIIRNGIHFHALEKLLQTTPSISSSLQSFQISPNSSTSSNSATKSPIGSPNYSSTINVNVILSHFLPLIPTSQPPPTPDSVLNIIQSSFETLNLTHFPNSPLNYLKYSESPSQNGYFNSLYRLSIVEARKMI